VWPNQKDSKVEFRSRYQNFIGGEWTRPVREQYFENITPVTGRPFCEVARSTAEDVEKALDAAHGARIAWSKAAPTWRAQVLYRIADRIEQNMEKLAVAETWDTGKPIRETLSSDLPLVVDQLRYFAGCLRAQEGSLSDIDFGTVAYHFNEPLGVVGQVLSPSFPLLSAVWQFAPALAAGNCVVIKPSEQTPASLLVLVDLIHDLLPSGVLNVVNGYAAECVRPICSNKRIQKVVYTGDQTMARQILQFAGENLVPTSLFVGGKACHLFFEDIYSRSDELVEKAMEGFCMFALNQVEIYGAPARSLLDAKIFPKFMERAIERTKKYVPGNPLDLTTTVGAQLSSDYLDKIIGFVEMAKKEGGKLLLGGERVRLGGELSGGYYMAPTIFQCQSKMRVFQEDVFGPLAFVAAYSGYEEAISVANDTFRGQSAGVWTRDIGTAYRTCRALQCNKVWTNCYQLYPANGAFGGYKPFGTSNENRAAVLGEYQQTKNLFVSYDPKPLGYF
jgi:aldehyde dehydrogenase